MIYVLPCLLLNGNRLKFANLKEMANYNSVNRLAYMCDPQTDAASGWPTMVLPGVFLFTTTLLRCFSVFTRMLKLRERNVANTYSFTCSRWIVSVVHVDV